MTNHERANEHAETAERLTVAWQLALQEVHKSPTVENSDLEDEAWNELIEFVEANGLNYTRFDPRGTA